jgi:exopolysaccharide biosynthesis operon protein EpsL
LAAYGNMNKSAWQAIVAGLLCATVAADGAWAAFGNDNLQLRAGANLRYDDNVFKQPDGVQTVAPDGSRGRSDTIRTLSAGISYVIPVSRQQFSLSADLNQTHYTKFSSQDFDGQDIRGLWRWEAGRLLNGEAGFSRARYQPGFANLTTPTPNVIGAGPNVRTTNQTFFTANYPFHANWLANVGLTDARYTNSNPADKIGDNDTSTRTYGLRYVSGLQNYVGVQGTNSETEFTTPQAVGAALIDNSFDQNTYTVVAGWAPGAASMVSGSIGRTNRDFHQPGRQSFGGTVASLLLNWRPTGKTALNVELSQDLSAANDLTTAGAKTRTFAFLPTWSATAKINVLGNYRRQERDYSTSAFAVTGGTAREDITTSLGLNVVYTPIRNVLLNMGAQNERRTSSVPGLDFDAMVYSAVLQVTF